MGVRYAVVPCSARSVYGAGILVIMMELMWKKKMSGNGQRDRGGAGALPACQPGEPEILRVAPIVALAGPVRWVVPEPGKWEQDHEDGQAWMGSQPASTAQLLLRCATQPGSTQRKIQLSPRSMFLGYSVPPLPTLARR